MEFKLENEKDNALDAKNKFDTQNCILEEATFTQDGHFIQKRTRTVMAPNQYRVLKNVLSKTSFPSTELREHLAKMLNMKPRTIQIWFQNQRQQRG